MITEVAILNVIEGKESFFEEDFKKASCHISSIKGYIKHSLHLCLEEKNKYLLLVEWENLKDHVEGFRNSDEYLQWKKILHHYYSPFPLVEHYTEIKLKN